LHKKGEGKKIKDEKKDKERGKIGKKVGKEI